MPRRLAAIWPSSGRRLAAIWPGGHLRALLSLLARFWRLSASRLQWFLTWPLADPPASKNPFSNEAPILSSTSGRLIPYSIKVYAVSGGVLTTVEINSFNEKKDN